MISCSSCKYCTKHVYRNGKRKCFKNPFHPYVVGSDCCVKYAARVYSRPFVEVRLMLPFYD